MATIKAGTYRFNDAMVTENGNHTEQEINFYFNIDASTVIQGLNAIVKFNCSKISIWWEEYNNDFNYINYVIDEIDPSSFVVDGQSYNVAEYLGMTLHEEKVAYKGSWGNASPFQTIVIPNDVEVSTEFAEWFNTNAVEQIPMTISGKWKFNDWLSVIPTDSSVLSISTNVNFESNGESYMGMIIVNHSSGGSEELRFKKLETENVSVYHTDPSGATLPWNDDGYKTISFVGEQKVMTLFYDWFTANATEVVEETPAATITYNGSTIASLFGGQTATLKCAGMKMESDVVVEVAEQSRTELEKILAPIIVTENGTYSEVYASGTVSWNAEDEYDTTIYMDGIPLRIKKVDLSVPSSLSSFTASNDYGVTVTFADGTQQTLSMSELQVTAVEMDGITLYYMSEIFTYAVIWVNSGAGINQALGINVFEDNSVYVSDFLWLLEENLAGSTITLVAPGVKADGISEVIVDVQPEPVPQSYVVKNSTKLPLEAVNGSFAFILGGE